MKFRIEIELPSVDQITRGLRPPSVKAAQDAAEAERTLAERRKELVDRKRAADEMPERVRSGQASSAKLAEALQKRDAAVLKVQQAELALTQAKERAVVEARDAEAAHRLDIDRRLKPLEDAAAQIDPVLIKIRELAVELARADGRGGMFAIDWTEPPGATLARFPLGSR